MGKGGQRVVVAPKKSSVVEANDATAQSNASAVWKSPYDPRKSTNAPLPKISDIKAVIPAHCFERSYVKSIYYTLRDTAWAVACVYGTSRILSTELPAANVTDIALWILGWNLYAFGMGTIMFGPWILGHECGHGAFSPNQTFNDIFGFVLHHIVLVPYFAWQYSHAKHHRRVNHLVDGESHVPSDKEDIGLTGKNERFSYLAILHEAFGDSGFAAFRLGFYLLAGYPIYLFGWGSTGRLAHDGTPLGDKIPDHYRPGSPMFPAKVYGKILLSTLAQCGIVGGLLYAGQYHYGHLAVFLWFWAPYLWVNAWLVIYTWLHHTDASVPHYGTEEWTWLKGALATIDRPYGIFDYFHHRIGSTHVVHHLFHELPWYHAYEATAAVKAYLEPLGLYNYDPTPFPIAMWRLANDCHYVESREGIQYYKSLKDIPKSSDKKKAV
jgi:omega-6 fatty acid desaturase / acyl-lipid omega-6 desaturase (Delta-12 desaturase)